MSYIHYIYVKVYYSVHTSDTPNKLSTIQFPFFSSLSENLNWKQCQHTQVIKWSVIRQSRDQVSGGYQPSGEGWHHSGFTLTPVSCPSFLPSVRGGAEKRLLASLLPSLPVRLIYRGVIWVLLCTCCSFYYSLGSKKLLEYTTGV